MRQIREAILSDVAAVMPVVDAARCMMHRSGNVNQWINGYPSASVIEADINRHGGFIVEDDGRVVAYFAFLPAPEPTYAHISPDAGGAGGAWLDGLPYHVIHRLAGLPGVHGIFRSVMDWAFCRTRRISYLMTLAAPSTAMISTAMRLSQSKLLVSASGSCTKLFL